MSSTIVSAQHPAEPEQRLDAAQRLQRRSSALLSRVDGALRTGTIAEPASFRGESPLIGTPSIHTTLKSRRDHEPVVGLRKFRATVQAEDQFLRRLLRQPDKIKPSHVQCSNIPYLDAVFSVLLSEPGVTQVFNTVHYVADLAKPAQSKPTPLRIDVIAQHGRRWIKVKASSLRGLKKELDTLDAQDSDDDSDRQDESDESDETDTSPIPPARTGGHTLVQETSTDTSVVADMLPLTIFRQAQEMLAAASQNPVHFQAPEVVFMFVGDEDIDARISSTLESLGVTVRRLACDADMNLVFHPGITQRLNFDITSLICLVSDLINRYEQIPKDAFDISALKLQSAQEQARPLLPALLSIMNGRELLIIHSAATKFFSIVRVIAGPIERRRALSLFRAEDLSTYNWAPSDIASVSDPESTWPLPRFAIVPDSPSDRFQELLARKTDGTKNGLQPHNINIIGTGDRLHCTTVAANGWLERTLRDSGFGGMSVWVHDPRSLVEARAIKYGFVGSL
ncbi:uncharacterized protein BJ171DRAFT_457692 [Polychytrium aggregatum]|uniref:uncharacterized protein n=1 Tax=Polychytrium aggregatum TaxID=110093 RepID=UPI0022FE6E21|nr:uncharacterized protein BJ171DRAFT_457692 [Polychytrium aggregatum]KAI9206092.1 hypothetical protein BJ171DRAFT_457692 [Polychytrium aggregatum]